MRADGQFSVGGDGEHICESEVIFVHTVECKEQEYVHSCSFISNRTSHLLYRWAKLLQRNSPTHDSH